MKPRTNTDTSTTRIVFAGTPDFAVPSLHALLESDAQLVAVYTQPDRPAGRGRRLTPGAVKQVATAAKLPVCQPATLRDEQTVQALRDLRPDLLVVAAYGLLLPPAVLAIPRLGCVNVHASILPRWRGAAPVQHAIMAGDPITGVTLMQMDAGLDTGDMIVRAETPIGEQETGGELTARLAELGAQLLLATLPALTAGDTAVAPQDDSLATLAPKIKKSDAEIDWSATAVDIARKVRAFNPWPVAQSHWRGKQLRIWQASVLVQGSADAPGTVCGVGANAIDVATGEGVLRIEAVQPAGKRRMRVSDFLNANDPSGDVFGRVS